MATVDVFTADRMLDIENTTIVNAAVVGDNLILYTREGTPIDCGSVRGPQGITGSIAVSAAGGDLAGNYPNPTIKTSLNDAAALVPSLRTLGTGSLQAARGNHTHDFSVDATNKITQGADFSVTTQQSRRVNKTVEHVLQGTMDITLSVPSDGDFTNIDVGTINDAAMRPILFWRGAGLLNGKNCTVSITSAGLISITSMDSRGSSYTVASGSAFSIYASFFVA